MAHWAVKTSKINGDEAQTMTDAIRKAPPPPNPDQRDDKLDEEELEILSAYEAGKTVAIKHDHAMIAQIMPLQRTMTASQALAELDMPRLTPTQAETWLKDSKDNFD